jgi:hypothetical protein
MQKQMANKPHLDCASCLRRRRHPHQPALHPVPRLSQQAGLLLLLLPPQPRLLPCCQLLFSARHGQQQPQLWQHLLQHHM